MKTMFKFVTTDEIATPFTPHFITTDLMYTKQFIGVIGKAIIFSILQ
jgi:hypothetical protein